MKIRWTENSLRFRITPTELKTLQTREGDVSATLNIPGGAWLAFIVPDLAHENDSDSETRLIANGNKISLVLALSDIDRLTAPDTEGVYFHMDTEKGRFRYFVEKDFPCIHPRTGDGQEPITEAFTPPEGFTERKGTESSAA